MCHWNNMRGSLCKLLNSVVLVLPYVTSSPGRVCWQRVLVIRSLGGERAIISHLGSQIGIRTNNSHDTILSKVWNVANPWIYLSSCQSNLLSLYESYVSTENRTK